jgi:hypothetical protein
VALWHRKPKQDEAVEALEPAPPFPEFPYHPDPRKTGSVVPSDARCTVCGHLYGLAYAGPVFSAEAEFEGVLCSWSIADGSAAAWLGVEFTDVGDEVPPNVTGIPLPLPPLRRRSGIRRHALALVVRCRRHLPVLRSAQRQTGSVRAQ